MPDEGTSDIWDAFDRALERARDALARAREHERAVEPTTVLLPEVYVVAIQELDATISDFDSVYEVTEDVLDDLKTVAARGELLADVTGAYREYAESVIDRRVAIAGEWFDELDAGIESEDASVAADRPKLSKQRQAIQKLVDSGRHSRLLTSDRVSLDAFESDIEAFDEAARDALNTSTYVAIGTELVASFDEQIVADISYLTDQGVDHSMLDTDKSIEDMPDSEELAELADSGTLTHEDAVATSTAVQTYADAACETGNWRARYEFGAALVAAVDASPLVPDDEIFNLRSRLSTLDVEAIESWIEEAIEGEATTSMDDRFRQLLAEHGGSIRRTARAMDASTDEVFGLLQELYENDEITDVEVQFE